MMFHLLSKYESKSNSHMATDVHRFIRKWCLLFYYFMLYTYFLCEYSHNFTTELMTAHLFFCIVPIFVNSLLLPLSKSTCSHPVNVSLLPVLPYAGGLYFKAQTGANLMAWGQDCKVGAVIVFFRILWWPCIVMNEQHFGHFSMETNSTKWRQAFVFFSAPLCH